MGTHQLLQPGGGQVSAPSRIHPEELAHYAGLFMGSIPVDTRQRGSFSHIFHLDKPAACQYEVE